MRPKSLPAAAPVVPDPEFLRCPGGLPLQRVALLPRDRGGSYYGPPIPNMGSCSRPGEDNAWKQCGPKGRTRAIEPPYTPAAQMSERALQPRCPKEPHDRRGADDLLAACVDDLLAACVKCVWRVSKVCVAQYHHFSGHWIDNNSSKPWLWDKKVRSIIL